MHNNKGLGLYPMSTPSGGPLISLTDFGVAFRRLRKRIFGQDEDISDNLKDRKLPFTEYPPCEGCGGRQNIEILLARDGNRIVECTDCGLWFTSPRVPEKLWNEWLLQSDGKRNIEFTENRLKYGAALSRNIQYSFSFWWRIRRLYYQKIIKKMMHIYGSKSRLELYDVGCGAGFLLKSALDLGVQVSGNDLNGYAVQKIRQVCAVEVYEGFLSQLIEKGAVRRNTYHLVTMNDFIEHSYHPLADLRAAYEIMREGGVLYVSTFCTDSTPFERLRGRWDMLLWNHTFHFSSQTLVRMITQAGFVIVRTHVEKSRGLVEVFAQK
ncbi:MAG: methyltransferase domain-containing protein [Proteobacteria bacterium]|nr:methyltransferase domain-containing protein [Desulfobulbaceae bacterium]MBU4152013.1 methyltransferase domain-containing protein [Pseudomonadota bacterium]